MKAGVVQALFALSALGAPEGVRLLVTTDEEVGSPSSRGFIEKAAAGLEAALVLEAAYEGALKVARKGTAQYTVQINGRAWHASEPARGANATLEMARQMLDVAGLADTRLGTTATPTMAAAGTTANTVPAHAEFRVDSRAASTAELERIERAMRALRPHLDGTEITVVGGIERAPMSREISRGLFERAQALAATLELPPLRGVLAPGGSDGQFTAAIGTPTLDGLGAVGGHAHAEGEWVDVERMPERAALLAALLQDILQSPRRPE
jgi:glutamate carboxypeptidase